MKKILIPENLNFTLHLGFPKTGTMALQNEIIPNLHDLTYIGMSANRNSSNIYNILTANIFPGSNPDFTELNNFIKENPNKSFLISHVYPTNPTNLIHFKSISDFINKISIFISPYNLIFTVRKPSNLLTSLYLHENKGLDDNSFKNWFCSERIQNFCKFLKYNEIHNVCKGYDINTLFIKQENFMANRQFEVNKICEFLKINKIDCSNIVDEKPHLRGSKLLNRFRIIYKYIPSNFQIYNKLSVRTQSKIFSILNIGKRHEVSIPTECKSFLDNLDKSYHLL